MGGSKVLLRMMGVFFGEIVSSFLYCKELRQVLRVGGSKVESKAKREEKHDETEQKQLRKGRK